MSSLLRFVLRPGQGPASILVIRHAVGPIFLTPSILKYIDPNMWVWFVLQGLGFRIRIPAHLLEPLRSCAAS